MHHARSELDEAQALRGARIEAGVVRVHIRADELPADDPLIRHVAARGLRRVGAQRRRHFELAGLDRRVRLEIGELRLLHQAAVELVFAVHRHAHAAEVAPIRVHDVVVHIAPDVVVVERAHARRQAALRIEGDDERPVSHRRVGDAADHQVRGRPHLVGIVAHGEHQAAGGSA